MNFAQTVLMASLSRLCLVPFSMQVLTASTLTLKCNGCHKVQALSSSSKSTVEGRIPLSFATLNPASLTAKSNLSLYLDALDHMTPGLHLDNVHESSFHLTVKNCTHFIVNSD